MSGIYIPGMEMPTGENNIVICSDGCVYYQEPDNYQSFTLKYSGKRAIPIQDHGRLDAMTEEAEKVIAEKEAEVEKDNGEKEEKA